MEYIYEWIENLAFYMVIMAVGIQMIPEESYKKYVRFFTGMILILLLAEPIVRIFGMNELELEGIENAAKSMEKIIGN